MQRGKKTVDIFIAEDGTEFFKELECLRHEEKLAERENLNFIQQINAREQERQRQLVLVIEADWATHPEKREAFIAECKAKSDAALQRGVDEGWWESVAAGNPIDFPIIIKKSELAPNETTMAHVMFKAGMFPSISDAKRNGWDKPIECAVFFFKKKGKKVQVVD